MSDNTDPYEDWDAAYVLGALPSSERREFEAHLRTCDRCSMSVAELASMPPLLTRVPADRALALLEDGAASAASVPDVLPALIAGVRRTRRRRRIWISAGGVAAAAALTAVLTLPSVLPAPADTMQVALTAAVPSPLTAEVDLIPESWGTRVEMTCSYRYGSASPGDGPWGYVLTVTDRSGTRTVVSSWEAGPGDTVRTTGTIDLGVAEIASIEVRSPRTGDVLLHGRPALSP